MRRTKMSIIRRHYDSHREFEGFDEGMIKDFGICFSCGCSANAYWAGPKNVGICNNCAKGVLLGLLADALVSRIPIDCLTEEETMKKIPIFFENELKDSERELRYRFFCAFTSLLSKSPEDRKKVMEKLKTIKEFKNIKKPIR